MSSVRGKAPDTRERLRALLSDCLVRTANERGELVEHLDVQRLQAVLGDDTPLLLPARYGLDWPGKRAARAAADGPSSFHLVPDRERSLDFDTTANLFVEGDNLEALKLLQPELAGQVKLIYIDPPYNTGNRAFVYNDAFAQRHGDAAGRLHAAWLDMIYPRLVLARRLLADEGVLFVSIDDNESANLRLVCDEIFGAENFVAQICHRARASVSNDKIISRNHNLILLYAKDRPVLEKRRRDFGLEPDESGFDREDERGPYKLAPVDGPGGAAKGNPPYEFLGVTGHFRFSRETMQRMLDEGRIVKRGNTLHQKIHLADRRGVRRTDTTWWDDRLYTSTATARLKELLGGDYFDGPKPVALVRRMLRLWAREPGDVVLDFFAGSGTTAHAVLEQSAEDGIRRRFVLVQIPEPCPPRSEAARAGFATIADIARERIRRAAALHPNAADRGFRTLRLVPAARGRRVARHRPPESERAVSGSFDCGQSVVRESGGLPCDLPFHFRAGLEYGAPPFLTTGGIPCAHTLSHTF